ncbi:hypothetical protein FQP88_16890 [Vibrio atlanticus]|nr:hypothetical protein FQP88_16890 [Vibrio atlanticus]
MSRRKFVKSSLKVSKSETKARTFYLVLELASIPLSVKSLITLAEEYKKHTLVTFMQHVKSFNKGQLTGNQVVGVQVRRKKCR